MAASENGLKIPQKFWFNFREIYTEEFRLEHSVSLKNFEIFFYDILIPFESLTSEYLVWKFLMEVPKFNEMP